MAKLDMLLDGLQVAGSVTGYTKQPNEGAKAAGYAIWVQKITGELPYVESLPGNRARLILTDSQMEKMRGFLDSQIGNLFEKGEPPTVDYGIGEVVKPLALRYTIPAGVIIFLVGVMAGKVFS